MPAFDTPPPPPPAGNGGGGPWAFLRTVLTTSGPVALIAIIVIVFMGKYVWERLDRIEANQVKILSSINAAQVAMTAFVASHTKIEEERSRLLRSQVHLLRELCVGAADSPYQRNRCLAEEP